MTTCEKLYKGISQIAWGYLFIFLHINIGTVDILPDFAGYVLFLSAINILKEFIPEMRLLRTIGIILTLWNFSDWVLTIIGYEGSNILQIISILITVINLYFNFQLLTNLATIAAIYQREGCTYDRKILTYRTFIVVLLTVFAVTSHFMPLLDETVMTVISLILIAGGVLAIILLMVAIFGLRKNLLTDDEKQPEQIP